MSVRNDLARCSGEGPSGRIYRRGTPIRSLAAFLASVFQRPVLDHTGLTGAFDYELRWNRTGSPDSQDPSIETALQEQLGLKLQAERDPVETIVMEHAEHPAPD